MTSREQGRELVRMSVGCSASVASSDLVARAISPGAVIFMCLNAWNSEFTCAMRFFNKRALHEDLPVRDQCRVAALLVLH